MTETPRQRGMEIQG